MGSSEGKFITAGADREIREQTEEAIWPDPVDYLSAAAALANLARAALRREAVFFFKRPFLTALSYSD